jgi:hypothetical protein
MYLLKVCSVFHGPRSLLTYLAPQPPHPPQGGMIPLLTGIRVIMRFQVRLQPRLWHPDCWLAQGTGHPTRTCLGDLKRCDTVNQLVSGLINRSPFKDKTYACQDVPLPLIHLGPQQRPGINFSLISQDPDNYDLQI